MVEHRLVAYLPVRPGHRMGPVRRLALARLVADLPSVVGVGQRTGRPRSSRWPTGSTCHSDLACRCKWSPLCCPKSWLGYRYRLPSMASSSSCLARSSWCRRMDRSTQSRECYTVGSLVVLLCRPNRSSRSCSRWCNRHSSRCSRTVPSRGQYHHRSACLDRRSVSFHAVRLEITRKFNNTTKL